MSVEPGDGIGPFDRDERPFVPGLDPRFAHTARRQPLAEPDGRRFVLEAQRPVGGDAGRVVQVGVRAADALGRVWQQHDGDAAPIGPGPRLRLR
jgi:hypothetical protein